jgi:hypothetical protein
MKQNRNARITDRPRTAHLRLTWLSIVAGSLLCTPAFAQPASTHNTRPDALLQIDLNRTSVVEKIVEGWKSEIPAAQIGSLRSKLSALRADQLLAASMSGSFDAVLEIMVASADSLKAGAARSIPAAQNSSFSSNISENSASDQSKAVGDATQDLVYTPIVPCRVFDTRTPGAPFVANGLTSGVVRTFDMDGANLSAQGGAAAGCNIPTAARTVVLAFSPINPPTTGWFIGAANDGSPMPASTLFNYSSALTLTTFTVVMPMLGQAGGDIRLEARGVSAYSVHGVGDVTGYFMPPTRNGVGLRIVTLPGQAVPNVINGDSTNAIITTSGDMRGATISGGSGNIVGDQTGANGWYGTIGGGVNNRVGLASGGGGDAATVSGGQGNIASGSSSTVAGGVLNTASGEVSTVAGGSNNTASGTFSFASGWGATADQQSCAIFAFWSSNTPFRCGAAQMMRIGADKGLIVDFGNRDVNGFGTNFVRIGNFIPGAVISAQNGAFLSSGGSWQPGSDRAKKENIRALDTNAVLKKVLTLPVTTWNYIVEGSSVKRIGPMAQDFYAAFRTGMDDKTIGVVDAQGVALAAIQGLNHKLQTEVGKLTREGKTKDSEITALKTRLQAIEKKLGL